MALWDNLISSLKQTKKEYANGLHQKIEKLLEQKTDVEHTEEEVVKIACISGLMARVAYIDFHIDDEEIKLIKESLNTWTKLSESEINIIADLAVKEVKELAGLENYLYTNGLKDLMDNDNKYQILETLFAIAAAHDGVDEKESEEIRTINHGLALEHKHFISARASVLKSLNALKS
tara:strand:- start:12842 stop:13372 length:531 start_codon:yes stop_codon:yes gene_type:complete